MISTPKILLIGDYSNCHANLAIGLKKLGCDVTLMSPVNYLSSITSDINTQRSNGKFSGLRLFLKAHYSWHRFMKGYDIVAINDPNFLSLRPSRLRGLFSRLKEENGSVFYTAMSTDVNYQRMCGMMPSPLRYSEFFINGHHSPWYLQNPGRWEKWHNPELTEYQDYVFDNITGGVAVLYEYYLGLRHRLKENKVAYGGIPVNTDEIPFVGPRLHGKIKIFLGRDRNRIKMKGTDLLEKAAMKAVEKFPDQAELKILENIPFPQFMEELKNSDIVLDQIYSYTPATTALLAMAMGKTVVSGAEPEYYSFINESDLHPIINADLDLEKLTVSIENIIADRNFIATNATRSRKFVEKHNKDILVAGRFLDFWQSFGRK